MFRLPCFFGNIRHRFVLGGMLIAVINSSGAAQSILKQEQQAIQQAVAAVNPSIVRIETVGGVDLIGDVLTGTGPTTGVIVSDDGFILTSSFNFVSQPASVVVTLPSAGNERFAAEVVSTDNSKMLTLLKIETSGLKPLQSFPKDEMRVGQRTIALGRTFDIEFPNISVGIVSALNRVQGKAIQTDAKTSPINYGGPLIDLSGRCLGIIVPLSPQQEGEAAGVEWYDSGIGFAIPLADIQRVLDRMTSGEDLHGGLLGVGFETQGPLSGEAKIVRVRPQSPADQAGLQVDDIIAEIDGREIHRLIDLQQVLGNRYAGETISLIATRGDESIERQIELAAELVDFQFVALGILPDRPPLTPEPEGLGVRFVFEDSPAQEAEVQVGDRILTVNGDEISTASDVSTILSGKKLGESVQVEVLRDDKKTELTVNLAPLTVGDGATNVPPLEIPRKEIPETLQIGRFNQKLAGSDRSFWLYVPENYNPEYATGLLVWVHPAGNVMEADVLRFWKDFCLERGIILAGPRAEDLSGWAATDEQHIKDIVDWVQDHYSIDAQRIAVMGSEDSSVFATRLAFKYRDVFRGLITLEGPLRIPPPENDPDHRLFFTFVAAPETRERERIEKSVELLREKKFPTSLLDAEEAGKFSLDLVNSLVQWLDALDRL